MGAPRAKGRSQDQIRREGDRGVERERMTHIRAFVIVINENNWRDLGDRIARQAAEYEQTVGKSK